MIIFRFFSLYFRNFEHLTLNKKEKAICINIKTKNYLCIIYIIWNTLLHLDWRRDQK